jgi:hypothetical protein
MSPGRRKTRGTSVARKRQNQLREASQLFVRLLQDCGYGSDEIQDSIALAVRRSPSKHTARRDIDVRYYEESPHVITHWYHDPDLLQANGQPRPLPLFGKTASVAALVARVNADLDPKVMVAYLLHIGGIRSSDSGWIPTRRYLLYANDLVSQSWHGFESLLGLLRTTEHNVHQKPTENPWYEARVMSGEIPIQARSKIDRRTRALGDDYLFALDRELQFQETRTTRQPARSIRIGVGTYYYELPSAHGPRQKKSR